MKRIIKWAGWLVGSAVIGALGTGVWENILKPTLVWVWGLLVNASYLGVTSFQNSMYKEIAVGYHERASLDVLTLAITFLLVAFIILLTTAVAMRGFMKQGGQSKPRFLRLGHFIIAKKYIYIPLAIIYVVFYSVFLARANYVSSAIAHYQQLIRIAAPYISPSQEEQYSSRFARIASRENYKSLVDELSGVISTQHITPPGFTIF